MIAASHEKIQTLWRKNGYDLSHRGGISWSLLEDLRSEMMQALSVSGFRESMLEKAKTYHFRLASEWRSYVDSLSSHTAPYMLFVPPSELSEMKSSYFHEFDSKEYGQPMPSVSYLISRVIRLMESDAEYQMKKMQMVDGEHLSGDHSFKLAKCILSNGSKAFTAMYTLMNEYGQVCACGSLRERE